MIPAGVARKYSKTISATAGFLASHGWAEANAGNLSIRLKLPNKLTGRPLLLPLSVPELIGCSLLIKCAGARMRDLARQPSRNLCLVSIKTAESALVVGGRPSSELTAHLAAHSVLIQHRPTERVFLHTHPTAIIALSLRSSNHQLPALLERMHTEAPLFLPDNLTALPFYPPGSLALGKATASALVRFRAVIWYGHGIVVSATDLPAAVDMVEVAEKCAYIALLSGGAGNGRVGLTASQCRKIRRSLLEKS